MKNRFLKRMLRVSGVLFALSGIIYLILYTQLMNSPVSIDIQNPGSFPLTTQNKIEDFEYVYNVLSGSFPYFQVKKRQYGIDWLSKKEEFIEKIKLTETDQEYYMILEEALMLLQNGHTNIIAPGSEFKLYSELYKGPHPWFQVYGNKKVSACYDYWKDIIPEPEQSVIPVNFRYIEGNYYANRNLINSERPTDELGVPMGSRLTGVNDAEVDQYIKSLIDKKLLRYDNLRKKLKVSSFSISSYSEVSLSFETPGGEQMKRVLKPYRPDALSDVTRSLPEHLYTAEILDKDNIAYLRLPSLAPSYVSKDKNGIREFIEQIRNYRALIIDIRSNGGGSNDYWMQNIVPLLTNTTLSTRNYILFRDSDYIKPFIKQRMFTDYFGLKKVQQLKIDNIDPSYYFNDFSGLYEELEYTINPRPVGFRGRIFLLVDDNVYSSAEAFAVFAKETGWATLVGTRTGGDGIGFDPVPVALPKSGLIVRFTADMGLNPDGSINEEFATEPDIYAEPSYLDFIGSKGKKSKASGNPSAKSSLPYDTILKKAVELASEY